MTFDYTVLQIKSKSMSMEQKHITQVDSKIFFRNDNVQLYNAASLTGLHQGSFNIHSNVN